MPDGETLDKLFQLAIPLGAFVCLARLQRLGLSWGMKKPVASSGTADQAGPPDKA